MLVPYEDLTPPTNRGVSLKDGEAIIKVSQEATTVDWLTCTTFEARVGLSWFDIWMEIARKNALEFCKDWSWKGYQGKQTEGARWGEGPYGYIFIVSGYRAHPVWSKIDPTVSRLTRVDLAVTLKLEEAAPGLCKAHFQALDPDERQRKYAYIENSEGGETLYVGRKSSDHYGRVYDKGAEQGGAPGGTYRYEVVLKKPFATSLMKKLKVYSSTARGLELAMDHARTFLWHWFDNRGVTPVFDRGEKAGFLMETEYALSTPEKRLQWLSHQVSPTVRKLMASGKTEETLRALALEQFLDQQEVKQPDH